MINSFNLSGSLALITGGAGLLGLKHMEAIMEADGRVVSLDINDEAIKKGNDFFYKKYKNQYLFLKVNITKESELIKSKNKILKTFSTYPNILINNATIDSKVKKGDNKKTNFSRLENFSVQQWNKEIEVGLTGAMLCSKIYGYEMSKVGCGVILNIASDLGIIAPNQNLYKKSNTADSLQNVKPVTYSVIKHGLIGLTRYLATYWINKGIRCNALAPGGVFIDQPDEFVKKISDLIPMGRMANIDEYKATIVYLCSNASSYMNGAIVVCDGGRTCW